MSIIGLLAANGKASGEVSFQGDQILNLSSRKLNRLRGSRISMVFQDPMTSLNPYLRIHSQMTEVLKVHRGMRSSEARSRAVAMLEGVRIPDAERRISMYPHQLSGGMRQRVMIAMALLCDPDLLIADEPTTALDVTLQAQIVDLLGELSRKTQKSVVMITHDLGVIAGLAHRVLVMYGGRIVETGCTEDIFYKPGHPYTEGLLKSVVDLDGPDHELFSLPGQPPNLQRLPQGCVFSDRCSYCFSTCLKKAPPLVRIEKGRWAACHRVDS
jgi:oligopeptide transport system ATP-binding protein